MRNTSQAVKLISAVSLASALAACGGGGDGGSSSTGSTGGTTTTPSQTVTGTQTTPQYAASSGQLAAFNLLNQYRTQCGFPALQQNTVLDQAAQAHAQYMGLNNAVSDTEVSGNQGYTGASYVDRAVHAGFPSTAFGPGVSAAYSSNAVLTDAEYGQNLVYAWLAGVYHVGGLTYPMNTVGIGLSKTQTVNGGFTFTNAWGSLSILNTQAQTISNGPLTFPCQGVTGVAYKAVGETPTPPNASASGWGTPVVVVGNPATDTIVLQSGSMTDPSGTVTSLQLLNSTNDPNKVIQPYQAVAYPAAALTANTVYTVSITGTINGKPFSRAFTFTTGNVVG